MSQSAEVFHGRSRIQVLVVDPDDETRSLYCESLRLAGCEVSDAADGRDALVKALLHRPALLITETRLPIFDGYALCEVLRRDSATHDVAILMVTVEARPSALDRARDAGADVVLTKPVSLDTLLKEIQQLLRFPERPNESAAPIRVPNERHCKVLSKAHSRFETTTPSAKPPDLVCPACNTRLVYESSHVGGVSSRHPEQWDHYACPRSCGTFDYRQRTRKLRRVL